MKQKQVRRKVKVLNYKKLFYIVIASTLIGSIWARLPEKPVSALEESNYVGSEKCAMCHADLMNAWKLSTHRRTLFNTDPAKKGCEGCHGPGKAHIEGDTKAIINPGKLKPDQIATGCMKCHTQEHVTLWRTGTHARAKLSCTECHDPHSPDPEVLSKDIENGKLDLEGLTTSIKQADLEANTAKVGSKEREEAMAESEELKKKRDALLETVKGAETVYKRVAEPYICYNCHKTQQVKGRMPYHHPIVENKMSCSDCHNPHGGPKNLLREESINQTCFKCHAEKEGPFTFEHPPVTEDCTNCHDPHGSIQRRMLVQSEPFVCLKCHAGPHSRNSSLASARDFATYYSQCTACHAAIHGSDAHSALHY